MCRRGDAVVVQFPRPVFRVIQVRAHSVDLQRGLF
jgi:hypothetical protein